MTDVIRLHAPSRATREISARSQGSARGGLDGPTHRIRTESGLELDVAYALLADPNVSDLWEQPPAVRYIDDVGATRFHTFDFLAYGRDGKKTAIEVKPEVRAAKARLKVASIATQARGFADDYVVLTEVDVDPVKAHDGRLIHDMRRHVDPTGDAVMTAHVDSLNGATTVACLVTTSGLGAAAFGAVVRLVGSGRLQKVDRRRLGYRSCVRRTSTRPSQEEVGL